VFGFASNQVYAVGDSGTIVRYEGSRWETMPSPKPFTCEDLGHERRQPVPVGENGTAMRFDGRRWYPLITPLLNELRAVDGAAPPMSIAGAGRRGAPVHGTG